MEKEMNVKSYYEQLEDEKKDMLSLLEGIRDELKRIVTMCEEYKAEKGKKDEDDGESSQDSGYK